MGDRLGSADYVAAVLASVDSASFQPVHVQKLFFLLDEKLGESLGGRYFDFQPYDYGPFDRGVYDSLGKLRDSGDLVMDLDSRGLRHYRLSDVGMKNGQRLLATLDAPVRDQIKKYASWVLSQNFVSLVSAIYKAYPRMKVNSVFSD